MTSTNITYARKELLLTLDRVSAKGTEYQINFWGGAPVETELVSYPTAAVDTLARSVRGYLGNYKMEGITQEERDRFVSDITKTKLGTPLEFLNFVFLIRNVPRSFTHQIVRTRIGASYVQESTRFIGARGEWSVIVPRTARLGGAVSNNINPYFTDSITNSFDNFTALAETEGVAPQDARQLLPHATLTHLFASFTLNTLMRIYEQRVCCQAELQTWVPFCLQAKELIAKHCDPAIAALLTAPIDRGQSCGFNASFDRPCTWKSRSGKEG